MATLNIGGKRVKVDDAFLSMTPEQQQATVDEIAGQIGGTPAPAALPAAPPTPEETAAAKVQAGKVNPVTGNEIPEFVPRGKDGQPIPGYDPQTGNVDHMGAAGTFGASMAEGVPIAGPLMDKAAMAGAADIGSLMTGDPVDKVGKQMQAMRDVGNEEHPVARLGGNLAGGLLALGPLGATEAGGWALGTRAGVPLASRLIPSMVSSGAISGADTAARGGDLTDSLTSAGIGAGFGFGLPMLGAGFKQGVGYLGGLLESLNPQAAAAKKFGTALAMDAKTDPTVMVNPADEIAAQAGDVPLVNADRGGPNTRSLVRRAANTNAETRQTVTKVAQDRFAGQSGRAATFMQRMMGNNLDNVAAMDDLQTAARKVNRPAWKKAYQDGAEVMNTPELERLMGSPAVVSAMKTAITKGKDRAIKEGMGTFNPAVSISDDGRITFNRVKPGGGTTFPDLQFWDYTRRELADMADAARSSGRKGEADTLGGLAKQLNAELDNIVPSYKTARAGSAAFFGAEDALDAGKQFAGASDIKAGPEMRKAFGSLSAPEQELFANGFASGLVKRIKGSPDGLNVINSVFKSQASREAVQLALGPVRARQVEAYVRIETLADRLRGLTLGSDTTQKLLEAGIGGLGGYLYTGDSKGAMLGAAAGYGRRAIKGQIEQNLMREIGKLATGDDPSLMAKLIHNASISPKYMQALDRVGQMLAVPSREGVVETNRQIQ